MVTKFIQKINKNKLLKIIGIILSIILLFFILCGCSQKVVSGPVKSIVKQGVVAANTAAKQTKDTMASKALEKCAEDLQSCENACVASIKQESKLQFNKGIAIGLILSVVLIVILAFIGIKMFRKE